MTFEVLQKKRNETIAIRIKNTWEEPWKYLSPKNIDTVFPFKTTKSPIWMKKLTGFEVLRMLEESIALNRSDNLQVIKTEELDNKFFQFALSEDGEIVNANDTK